MIRTFRFGQRGSNIPNDVVSTTLANRITMPSGMLRRVEPDIGNTTTIITAPGLFTDAPGTTGATTGLTVKNIKEWIAGKSLSNASGSGNTASIVSNLDATQLFNGRTYLAMAGSSSTQGWLQGAAAADWSHLHQGPCTWMLCMNPSNSQFSGILFDTGAQAVHAGTYLYYENTSPKVGSPQWLSRGTGTTDTTSQISISQRAAGNNSVPAGTSGVISGTYDGLNPGTACLYYNRGLIGAPQTGILTPSTNPCHDPIKLGDDIATGAPWKGSFAFFWTWNRVLSNAEFSLAHQVATQLYGVPTVNVACIGDSLTAGNFTGTVNGSSYPARMDNRLGCMYNVFNFGHSGDRIANTKTIFESNGQVGTVPACYGVWRNGFKIVCIGVGVNDLGGDGTSGSTAFNALKVILDEITADSQTLCVVRTLPLFKGNASFWATTTQADVDFFNNAVRNYVASKPSQCRLFDFNVVFKPNDGYTMPTSLSFDGLHTNMLGKDIEAAYMSQLVLSFGL